MRFFTLAAIASLGLIEAGPLRAMETLSLRVTPKPDVIEIEVSGEAINRPQCAVFVAIESDAAGGCAVVPFGKDTEGSTVFLPFGAERIYDVRKSGEGVVKRIRIGKVAAWGPALDVKSEFDARFEKGRCIFSLRKSELGAAKTLRLAAYAKDMRANGGWGEMLALPDLGIAAGINDRAVPRALTLDLADGKSSIAARLAQPERVRIYQLLPRIFGNTNETRKINGTLAENGVGKFADINDAALSSIRAMGFTHVWFTGVLQQATATDYAAIGAPADDSDLLKGLAGSPYAIKNYFNVSPDYATDPAKRIDEFYELLARVHSHGMRAIIDLVPNHVARSYQANRPAMPEAAQDDTKPAVRVSQESLSPLLDEFGGRDDRTKFSDPLNNFFWLTGKPLELPTCKDGHALSPTCKVLGNCDGRFEPERENARVSGNNVTSPAPSIHDWYETVKLNYGFDFTSGRREFPHADQLNKRLPDTWVKMDRILAYWQALGVDGFRCDMAHMVPPEFWNWSIGRARERKPDVFFIAEAYDNDPAKVQSGDPLFHTLGGGHGNVMIDLLSAGFNAVYDDPAYKKLKAVYDGGGWANDLDAVLAEPFIFHNSLHYAENHDEVRIAGKNQWGSIGARVGLPVSAILYGLGRGPALLYSGQEIGEPADGAEGFGGDDARTTIFDYWSMPEFVKWVNGLRYDGARLSPAQTALRAGYARLVKLTGEPAFHDGECFPLNGTNNVNEHFGRLAGEPASGHWLYAFVRSDGRQHFLVVVNLHREQTLRDVRVQLSAKATAHLALTGKVELRERLESDASAPFTQSAEEIIAVGVKLPALSPLTACYFELRPAGVAATSRSREFTE